MQAVLQTLRAYLQRHFLARWILANAAGWSLGLYLGSLCLAVVGGLIGLILGGALAGGIAGAAQGYTLRGQVGWSDRRWTGFSALGGGLAALPAFAAGVSLLAGWGAGTFIVGGVFGGVFGAAQAAILNRRVDNPGLWIVANVLGGALCGLFSLAVNPLFLPICCTLGPVLFGGLTGWVLMRLVRK